VKKIATEIKSNLRVKMQISSTEMAQSCFST